MQGQHRLLPHSACSLLFMLQLLAMMPRGAAHHRPCICLVPVFMPAVQTASIVDPHYAYPAACSKMASYTAPQSVMQTIPDDDGDQVGATSAALHSCS